MRYQTWITPQRIVFIYFLMLSFVVYEIFVWSLKKAVTVQKRVVMAPGLHQLWGQGFFLGFFCFLKAFLHNLLIWFSSDKDDIIYNAENCYRINKNSVKCIIYFTLELISRANFCVNSPLLTVLEFCGMINEGFSLSMALVSHRFQVFRNYIHKIIRQGTGGSTAYSHSK